MTQKGYRSKQKGDYNWRQVIRKMKYQNDSNWGDKIVDKLVEFMKREYPTMKRFTRREIYRMKQFYETYKENEIVSTLLTQISWSNNVIILSSTNSM